MELNVFFSDVYIYFISSSKIKLRSCKAPPASVKDQATLHFNLQYSSCNSINQQKLLSLCNIKRNSVLQLYFYFPPSEQGIFRLTR